MTVTPVFATGDILSAAKLNAMLDEIDVLVGLDEMPNTPVNSGADIIPCDVYGLPMYPWQKGSRMVYWFAHNGNQLKLFVEGSEPAYLWWNWDGSLSLSDYVVPGNTHHTITLSPAQLAGLYQYQPVRVMIQRVQGETELFVRYCYQTSSTAPAVGRMPTFDNGEVSKASDLNQILTGIDNAAANLRQPVPCQYSNPDRIGDRNGIVAYVKHKHERFVADVTVTTQGYTEGEQAFLRVHDMNTNAWSWSPGPNNFSYDGQRDGLINVPVPAGINIGDWYRVWFGYFRANQSPPSNTGDEHEQRMTLWSYAEHPDEYGIGYDQTTRWTHGDAVYGRALASPHLSAMSNILEGIGTGIAWINKPCKQAGIVKAGYMYDPCGGGYSIDSMSARRVYRWLAYSSLSKPDGTRDSAQLQWFTQGRNLQSYTMPQVDTPSFFDLESTPIKPGMWFRVSGVNFAIQTPVPGVNYA